MRQASRSFAGFARTRRHRLRARATYVSATSLSACSLLSSACLPGYSPRSDTVRRRSRPTQLTSESCCCCCYVATLPLSQPFSFSICPSGYGRPRAFLPTSSLPASNRTWKGRRVLRNGRRADQNKKEKKKRGRRTLAGNISSPDYARPTSPMSKTARQTRVLRPLLSSLIEERRTGAYSS